MPRLLKIIFVIILSITLVETGLYVYILFQKKNSIPILPSTTATDLSKNPLIEDKTIQSIQNTYIPYLKSLDKTPNQRILIVNEIYGRINNLILKDQKGKDSNILTFDIFDTENKNVQTVSFTADELSQLKITKQTKDDKGLTVPISALSGKKIRYTSTRNLVNNAVSDEIIVYD